MRTLSTIVAGSLVALAWAEAATHPALSQDAMEPPFTEKACNAACRWWMQIGREAEPTSPTGLLAPATPHDGAATFAEVPTPPRRIRVTMSSPGRRPPPRTGWTDTAAGPPPRSPAAGGPPALRPHAGRSAAGLWGVPLGGSVPVLATSFARR